MTPQKWTRQGDPVAMDTTELFVSGPTSAFDSWQQRLLHENAFPEGSPLQRIEQFRAPGASDKKRGTEGIQTTSALVEVGLHLPDRDRSIILSTFEAYAAACGAEADMASGIRVAGLAFIPVRIQREEIDELSKFSFLRVVRPMPRLRALHPIERSTSHVDLLPIPLPGELAVDPSVRVAVFDGGLPSDHPFGKWASGFHGDSVGEEVEELLEHGHNVTSAVLFGPLSPGIPAPRPFAEVDHYRILDADGDDDYDLYRTLKRITSVLEMRPYEFVNLSLGPDLPIEDDEVHPWTAVLDEYLSQGNTLLTVAAGNNGQSDRESGNARVQVPSDSVNSLAVGSADSRRTRWERASYSALGPGRSPGMVKPDILNFGGETFEPFCFAPRSAAASPTQGRGTSFAAPAALRMATAIRAHFGSELRPLALKALLIHCAERDDLSIEEAGWGRIPDQIDDFVLCQPNAVRVVYQGSIEPGQAVRMPIPLPESVSEGDVRISATYCINSPVDARTPSTYTGSAIEPFFRPHAERMTSENSTVAATRAFFQTADYATESDLRKDAHKWETIKHKTLTFRASSLYQPVFDVRHVSRVDQLAGPAAERVEYAFVVTLTAPKHPEIYNQVVRSFAGRLEILQPQIEIPINIRP
ncbi:S8 family peptidase [Kitasatospora sp. NPDC097605]|uniref:S8 family peptidase n=1 Tax=Kitasatospora sp. NPDC097605 TaxID=3157226 RepID=UPI00332691B8